MYDWAIDEPFSVVVGSWKFSDYQGALFQDTERISTLISVGSRTFVQTKNNNFL